MSTPNDEESAEQAAAVRIQSQARRRVARRRVALKRAEREERLAALRVAEEESAAAVRIQSHIRGHRVRRDVQSKRSLSGARDVSGSAVAAAGFSSNTCFPACKAFMVYSKWVLFGVFTITSSISSSANNSSTDW